MSTEYPEDEFDAAGRERTPEGVHREPRSPLATVLPFVAVLVLLPLLAWAAVSALSRDPGPEPEPAATATAPATQATTAPADGETTDAPPSPAEPTEPPAEETEAPSVEPTPDEPTPEETLEADLGVSISVLNGAGITGLAGDAAAELAAAGFSGAVAADYGAAAPQTTTLYYRNAELAPTAQAIGEILGITNLVEAPSATENVQIAIVLRADYAR